MNRRMSIYIHIPFCVKKCGYCDFLSFPVGDCGNGTAAIPDGSSKCGVPEKYLQRLFGEIRQESGDYADREVDTIFVGGGTPSLLLPRQVAALFDRVYQSFHVASDAEITIEANPGTLSKEKLKVYRQVGINRMSIGLQSADDGELAALGRIHRFSDFEKNFELARDCGFQNINIDLMSGLPGQSVESWLYTLHTAAGFDAEHISAYGLIIEEGTPFYQQYGVGSAAVGKDHEKLPSEEAERQMYHETGEVLERFGYQQYEISNYAKRGYECRHNIGYWIRKEYVGFGLGAASMINNIRWKNTSDLKKYMKNTDGRDGSGGKGAIMESAGALKEEVQTLTLQEQMEETMFLGLRMNQGVSKREFEMLYGVGIEMLYGAWIHKMTAEELLLDGDRIYLSERGRDLANYVMAGFLQG
ncbi:MAG: radical SAM family heme chaperone HemW [Lachnospiraceae bacterium]|nr:radical SAM family heme chaperone HemW [Lachnospiraceae bacterium]